MFPCDKTIICQSMTLMCYSLQRARYEDPPQECVLLLVRVVAFVSWFMSPPLVTFLFLYNVLSFCAIFAKWTLFKSPYPIFDVSYWPNYIILIIVDGFSTIFIVPWCYCSFFIPSSGRWMAHFLACTGLGPEKMEPDIVMGESRTRKGYRAWVFVAPCSHLNYYDCKII